MNTHIPTIEIEKNENWAEELIYKDEKIMTRIKTIMNFSLQRMAEIRLEHIEAMAAAYLLSTDIHPADVELVEERRGFETVWYYRKRQDDDDVQSK